jgi:hypothetical protein
VRLSPERATFSQFLPAAEQRALERELATRSDSRRKRTLALGRCGLGQPPIASR